jgi:hypothetical protein
LAPLIANSIRSLFSMTRMLRTSLLMLLLPASLLLAACGARPTSLPPSPPRATATPAPIPASSATAPPSSPAAANVGQAESGDLAPILAAQRAQLKASAFRIVSTSQDAGTASVTVTMEYVAPDRLHMMQANGDEYLLVDGSTWERRQGGHWSRSPADLSPLLATLLDASQVDQLRGLVVPGSVKALGRRDLAGVSADAYEYATVVESEGLRISSRTTMWIGATGLPLRLDVVADSPTKANAKETSSVVYTYDPSITIDAPAP